ncbi:MAG: HNH endonuclease [Thiobacillus sp.]|nr:HNH endonuclease [Thiobacillus sp.]
MWTNNPHEFANAYGITLKQARRFQCTGEHLVARQEGGSSAQSNIVAACRFCNETRHRRKTPLPPDRYMRLVHERIKSGRWHGSWGFPKGLSPAA